MIKYNNRIYIIDFKMYILPAYKTTCQVDRTD